MFSKVKLGFSCHGWFLTENGFLLPIYFVSEKIPNRNTFHLTFTTFVGSPIFFEWDLDKLSEVAQLESFTYERIFSISFRFFLSLLTPAELSLRSTIVS